MSVANPETMSEWMEYIATLGPDEITSKARAANSQKFASILLDEGFTMADFKTIVEAFARKCIDLNVYPPMGYLDLPMIAKSPKVQEMTLPNPEDVDWEPEPDKMDAEIDKLDLDTEWEDTELLSTR